MAYKYQGAAWTFGSGTLLFWNIRYLPEGVGLCLPFVRLGLYYRHLTNSIGYQPVQMCFLSIFIILEVRADVAEIEWIAIIT